MIFHCEKSIEKSVLKIFNTDCSIRIMVRRVCCSCRSNFRAKTDILFIFVVTIIEEMYL